jgi:hypothetical protein
MDRIRTLLLARAHVVVMDPDLVAQASTAPVRVADVENLEDELAQLGFVLSIDLATTLRRLPYQAMQEMRSWIHATLAKTVGAHRPHVPLFRKHTPGDTETLYRKRMLSWLLTRADQPCPWCGQVKTVGALDPCGHLVCRACWDGANFAGCPICHRRVSLAESFVKPAETGERITHHSGQLTLVHLGLDATGMAKQRFERLLARQTPLSPDDRDELEAVLDTIGPRVVTWLPPRIPVKETMALAIARLWLISPNRSAMVKHTAGHLRTATDVLRVACVLMGGNPELVEPMRLHSIPRGLRRAVLEALDALDLEQAIEDVMRHVGLWKRVGEQLHPFELAGKLPNAALAFAVVRGTNLAKTSFGPALRERAVRLPYIVVEDDKLRAIAWAGPIEDALRGGNPRSALARLTHRSGELLRRADHLVRTAQARQPDALNTILKAVELAAQKGAPGTLLTLASHVARRGRPWPRRVFFPKGEVLRAWGAPDERETLRGDAIAVIVGAIRRQLLARADTRRQFPRAVIDRALVDLLVPINERSASRAKLAWPRGSELALPDGQTLRLFLHWEQPQDKQVDLDLSVALFDAKWRHVATCDFTNLVVGSRAAVHSGDLTDAPAPLGASEFVDLHLEQLALQGARHAVMVVFSYNSVPFDQLPFGFAGLMLAPDANQHFDPRAVVQRFDLRGRSVITVPLTIDLGERRMRWLDVHVKDRGALHQVGGYRAALAHLGRDFGDLIGAHSRPTMWDVACIHAAARANTIYVRERDGSFTTYRRRDTETKYARLGRLMSGVAEDGKVAAIPSADAPTWFALMTAMPLPKGSQGYALDARGHTSGSELVSASDLIGELSLHK